MAHEGIIRGEWYTDADMNALVKALRLKKGLASNCDYLLKDRSSDGFHVVLLDVANGQKGATVAAQNLDWHLNRRSRPQRNLLLKKLAELKSVPSMTQLTQLIASEKASEIIAAQIYEKFGNFKGDITAFRAAVELAILEETGKDAFDEIEELLRKGDSQFRILFPLNVGRFDAKRSDTGVHWVFGEINIIKLGNNITVDFYKRNSFGNDEFTAEELSFCANIVHARLQEIVDDDVKITLMGKPNRDPKRQEDSSSCGAYAFHGLQLRAEGKQIADVATPSATELRQQHYKMIAGVPTAQKIAAVSPSRAAVKPIDEKVFQRIFKEGDVKVNATLHEDGQIISTTDLSLNNLKALVEKIAALMYELKLGNELEMYAPDPESRKHLEALCAKHHLKLKRDPEPMVHQRFDRTPVAVY